MKPRLPALCKNCGWPAKTPRRKHKHPWPDGVVTLQGLGSGDEYNRILNLIRSGELKGDPTLIIFSSDGILHFSRADLIPWFYCSTERVEELLEMFMNTEWP